MYQNLLPSHASYVSSTWTTHTVVSGPNSTLRFLQRFHGAGDIVPDYPIYAKHLYGELDIKRIRRIIKSSCKTEGGEYANRTLLSASREAIKASSGTGLLLEAAEDLLKGTQHSQKLVEFLSTQRSRGKFSIYFTDNDEIVQNLTVPTAVSLGTEIKTTDICAPVTNNESASRSSRNSIAIVGMACRFPQASDPDLLWELLQAGLDVHQKVPPDRFDHVSHTDPTGRTKNSSKTPYGCFLDDAGLFDNAFFNMSAKEAAQTDPAQRLMLLTAYEALEMSGFVPNRTPSSMPDRVATFYGQASDDWRETNSSQSIGTYFIPGGIRAFGPGRINYHLKFSGPSYCVDTACSSSFAAIHMAFNSLLANDCDTAVVGGANILTNPDIFAGLSRAHFLSTTGSCKTFDAEADGYCRGDGVGSVVMKRLEDAVNDNDRILGVILGVATNHSADAVSITHPHAPTQASLYRSILNTSRIRPTDVDYVEMHGTGTVAGRFPSA